MKFLEVEKLKKTFGGLVAVPVGVRTSSVICVDHVELPDGKLWMVQNRLGSVGSTLMAL